MLELRHVGTRRIASLTERGATMGVFKRCGGGGKNCEIFGPFFYVYDASVVCTHKKKRDC